MLPHRALNNTCGGTATAVVGFYQSVSLTGGTLAAASSCTVSLNVQGTTGGVKNNSVTVSSTNGGTGNTSNASIAVVGPPTISKAFGAANIPLNGSTSLSFTIQNPNITSALTGVGFSDTLPTGLVVFTPNGLTGSCGSGTITATAGAGTISLSGGTIAANSSCTFSVNVTGTTAGTKNNTTGNVTSTEGGTGGTASASVNVVAPPSIAKVFNPTSIAQNATTSLTFTITNPAANTVALTGVSFTDTLPTGLTVANASATVCGGTLTTTAPTGIALTGATIAANGQCQFSVTVTGVVPGSYTNTTGNVTSTNGGTGNTASANLTVVTAPPVITKAFGATSIPLNGTTSLSFTIQNNNSGLTLHGVGFTDAFPAGLIVATPNGLTGSCGGGTISAIAGGSGVSLSGATLGGSTSCTFAVNVTGTTAGLKTNTTSNVTSTEGGAGGTTTASIKVEAPPSIAKVFNPASIALNATTSLAFTITNPAGNVDALTGVAFTDTLPTGLTIASASATVCGGTLTTTAPTGIALTGATIAANGQCQFSVTVTGAASGQYTNTTGNVTSTNGGTGNTASANLSVATPPSITKTFNPIAIPLNGSSTLSFSINNPDPAASLTGVAFTDSLPAGLVVATPNGLTGSCGGGTITATAGSSSVSLSGATLAASASCTLNVKVTPTTGGVKNNSVTVTASQSGPGNTSNATLTVTSPPTLTKAFGAATIPLNGTTTLMFTVTNPNPTVALTGIQFGDTLPAGLKIPNPTGLTGSCGAGTITPGSVSGFSIIGLLGGTLPAGGSCTFSVNVVGIAAGTQNNTTGLITSVEGGTGGTASASVNVVAPPSIAKVFNPAAIGANGVSTLTFTLTNPAANGVAEAGVAFTDTLPTGLVIATPNGLGGSCTGTATATAGSGSISFSGGSIPVNSSCTVTVNITGAVVGIYQNTTGAVSSTNGGTGNTASATLTIAGADLTITKTHTGTFNRGQNGATYTVVVNNSGAVPTTGAVTVVDSLPAFMLAAGMSGTGWTCTLNPLSCTRSDSLAPGASYPPITVTVNIGQNIANTFSNTATVSGGGETNISNDTAVDTITLGPPIVFQPLANSATSHGSTASMQFNLQVDDPSVGAITFGCTGLPANSSCTFNPPTTSQTTATVTMTVSAADHGTSLSSNASASAARKPRFYAALAFPVFGLIGIAFSGRKKKNKLRLMTFLMGLMVLLGSIGCGGFQGLQTPAGSFQITVTATSASAQVSVPVSLTIR